MFRNFILFSKFMLAVFEKCSNNSSLSYDWVHGLTPFLILLLPDTSLICTRCVHALCQYT